MRFSSCVDDPRKGIFYFAWGNELRVAPPHCGPLYYADLIRERKRIRVFLWKGEYMSPEQYRIGTAGRVKAAGVPMDLLFDPGEIFAHDGSPSAAMEMTKRFLDLRQAPPEELRDRIFPRSRGTKDQFRSGALLTRPILKTDQGAGQFLSFENGSTGHLLRYEIAEQSGFCITEPFFEAQLAAAGYPADVMSELATVREQFGRENLHEAQLAYERMQIAAEKYGIQTEREAGVGRDALFFIRPSLSTESVRIPHPVMEKVQELVDTQTQQFRDLAREDRVRFIQKHGLSQGAGRYNAPLYFQADVQLLPDGTPVLDQIHLPDVGLFLTTLDPGGNVGLKRVYDATIPLAHNVVDVITTEVRKKGYDRIYVITRDEVLENNEDVLEQREIQAFSNLLGERGITVTPITVKDVPALGKEEIALLLNVETDTQEYESLLFHHISGVGPAIHPDPFLKRAISDVTGYKRTVLSTQNLESLRAIVQGAELKGSQEGIFRATLALDSYLRRLGIDEDVFHLHISSQRTPVACYRYDVRGMQIALGYASDGDSVVARGVPISPHRAVLFRSGRPTYTVFRFMATRLSFL